jgi:hypothetical protein
MSTLTELFTLRLPDYWTPAEALAVYEFLNKLAETIWNRYEVDLIEQLRSESDYGDTSQLDLFDFDDHIPF